MQTSNSLNTARSTVRPRWGNAKTATEYSGLPKTRLHGLLNAGRIKSAKIGRQRLFDLDSIDALLEDGGTNAA